MSSTVIKIINLSISCTHYFCNLRHCLALVSRNPMYIGGWALCCIVCYKHGIGNRPQWVPAYGIWCVKWSFFFFFLALEHGRSWSSLEGKVYLFHEPWGPWERKVPSPRSPMCRPVPPSSSLALQCLRKPGQGRGPPPHQAVLLESFLHTLAVPLTPGKMDKATIEF